MWYGRVGRETRRTRPEAQASRTKSQGVHVDKRQIEVVDDRMAEVLRGKTGAERLAIAFGLYSSARRMLISALRSEHPDWTEEQINAEAARRLSHGAV